MKHPKPDNFKPVGEWPKGHAWHGQGGRCTGWSRNAGRQCTKRAIRGRTKCKNHGGKSLRGVNSPRYKGKGKSIDMPTRLAEQYRQWLEDEDRLSIDKELAIMRTLFWGYVTDLGEEGSIPLWKEAKKLFRKFRKAWASEDPEIKARAGGYLLELEQVLIRGAGADAQEKKIFARVQTIERLQRAQATLDETKGKLIQLDTVYLLLGAIFDTIRRDVANLNEGPQIISNLGRALAAALGPVDSAGIESILADGVGKEIV